MSLSPNAVRAAWSDESFQEKDSAGFYIIAAAVLEPASLETARDAMLQLRGRRAISKSHWTEMDRAGKERAVELVGSIANLHVVAIGSPVPAKKQERARSKCLRELVTQLHGFEVSQLYMEAREGELNRRDVRTVQQARQYGLPKGTKFRIDHLPGGTEPLLWVADVVAGACRAEQLGTGEFREALGDTVLDFEVATDC